MLARADLLQAAPQRRGGRKLLDQGATAGPQAHASAERNHRLQIEATQMGKFCALSQQSPQTLWGARSLPSL
jgi:hypothetical protein